MKSDTSDSGSRWLWFALSASTVALVLERLFGRMFTDPDVPFYLDIAKGNMAAVLQPFASRQLHPHLARWLAEIFHLSLQSGFIAEQVISLFILTAALGWLLDSMGAGRRLLLAVAGTSFWAAMFNGVGLPDLGFSALLGIFLVLLYRQKWLAAAAMLFLMFLSRESTVLVLVCLLMSGWRELRVSGRIVALSASAAGQIPALFLCSREVREPNEGQLGSKCVRPLVQDRLRDNRIPCGVEVQMIVDADFRDRMCGDRRAPSPLF